MRRPSSPQSTLRYPLNAILASEGNVRVVRELFRHGGELSAPAIASRVGLTAKHVRQVAGSLVALTLVEEVGQGRYLLYRLRRAHALYTPLDTLFRAESERFEGMLRAIRNSVVHGGEKVRALWLYGSAARGDDRPGSDVDLALVAEEDVLHGIVEQVRARLRASGEVLGLGFSVVGLTPADVLRLSAGDPWWNSVRAEAIPLVGPDPDHLAAKARRDGGTGAPGVAR